jgi:ribose transport system substrate-binding protein
MSRRIGVWRLALLLLMVVILVSPPAQAAEPKKYNFMFIPGEQSPFYNEVQRGAQQAADLMGVNLIVKVPSYWDASAQAVTIDAAIARKDIDFMLIVPVDVQDMVQPLKRVADAGIPLLTVDTFIGTGEYGKPDDPAGFPLSYIGSDNVQGGKIAAEALGKALAGKGKVYVYNEAAGISTLDQRRQGFIEGIKQFPGMSLVGLDQFSGEGQVAAVLRRETDLAGIFGTHDSAAEEAGNAVKSAGLSGKVKVVSLDTTPRLIDMLKAGTVDVVIAQKPAEMGFLAVEMGLAYVCGYSDIPRRTTTGYVVIDKSNVNDPNFSRWFYGSASE